MSRESAYWYGKSASGQVEWQWDNTDPFGANAPNQNPTGQGNFTFNLRFPGQYFDTETNTHYNINRDYDPTIGRYVESDPIGLAGGSFSTYTYVNGNPSSRIDPSGLSSWGISIGGALTAITGIEGSVALVWNTGSTPGQAADIGIQVTSGPNAGANVGAAVSGLWYPGAIKSADGQSNSVNGGIGPISGSIAVDPATGEIAGASFSPIGTPSRLPFAISIGRDQTSTWSVMGNLLPWIENTLGIGNTCSVSK